MRTLMIFMVLCSGCAMAPLKGGRASTTTKPGGAIEQSLAQSENPADASEQEQETVSTKSYTVPAGSVLEERRVTVSEGGAVTNVTALVVREPMPVVERSEQRARVALGASQKDTARELAAKLSGMKGIVWVGVALFVFGLASLFYPPLRALIGSVTTSAALTLGGLALIVLPTLIVGNELLILGGVGFAVTAWFLAHRHGRLQGFVDANRNGVDDRVEGLTR